MWIGNLWFYAIPSILYIATLIPGWDLPDYAFVIWMNVIRDAPIVMFFFTTLLLFVGGLNLTEGTYINAVEVWSVASSYAVFAIVTGII